MPSGEVAITKVPAPPATQRDPFHARHFTEAVKGTVLGVQVAASVDVASRFVPWPPMMYRGE